MLSNKYLHDFIDRRVAKQGPIAPQAVPVRNVHRHFDVVLVHRVRELQSNIIKQVIYTGHAITYRR